MMIRLFAFGHLMMALTLVAAPREAPMSPPPPLPQPGHVSIFRGRSVEIPLRAVGRAPKALTFLIRSQPTAGTLGPIRSTGLKSAVVTYTHRSAAGAGTDTFTYAVQGLGTPVSAPARLTVQISEEPPALSVVHALDFGHVMLGESREEEIVIRNTGGGLLSGKMTVPGPWKILGSAAYRLKRHEERRVRLLFDPVEERGYHDNLSFSHDARSVVALTGEATAPLGFDPPGEMVLEASGTSTSRTGILHIENLTPTERTIELEVPPGILVADSLTLPGGGTTDLTLATSPDFTGSGEKTLKLNSEGFQRKIPLRILARQPRLVFAPADHLDFGKVEPGQLSRRTLEVTNRGGLPARLTGTMPADIMLRPVPDSIVLAPDETRAFEVTLESRRPGPYRSQITLGVEGSSPRKITVTAAVGQSPSTAAKVPTTMLAPRQSSISQEEGSETPPRNGSPAVPEVHDVADAAIESFSIQTPSDHEVEISWRRPAGDVAGYVFEQRFLKVVPEGPPQILWRERQGMKFSEAQGMVTARFENLAPGQTWDFRVRTILADGRRSTPSPTLRMTSPPRAQGFGLRSLFLVVFLLLAGAGGWAWFQIRRSGESHAAARLADLERETKRTGTH